MSREDGDLYEEFLKLLAHKEMKINQDIEMPEVRQKKTWFPVNNYSFLVPRGHHRSQLGLSLLWPSLDEQTSKYNPRATVRGEARLAVCLSSLWPGITGGEEQKHTCGSMVQGKVDERKNELYL